MTRTLDEPAAARVAEIVAGAVSLVDAAMACRAGGFTPQECAPVLHREYPDTSVGDMATVLAAVWPQRQYANQTYLTTALVDAGYDPTAASAAAAAALAVYHDVFMRDELSDTGTVPSPGEIPYVSPDIVPYGDDRMPDPQQTLTQQWTSDIGKNIVATPSTNYVYVRGRNLFPGPMSGTVTVYWSAASLLLKPSVWTTQPLPNSNGTNAAAVSADAYDEIVVGDAPFLWQTDPPPAGDHFCLVSQVVTELHPDPIPPDDSIGVFAEWVRDNPGIAWRNTSVVAAVAGGLTQTHVTFANPEPQALPFVISATCTGLPAGTVVAFSCPAPGPNPPIDVSTTIAAEHQSIGVRTTLPASFDAILVLNVQLPSGTAIPAGAKVDMAFVLHAGASSPYAAYATVPVPRSRLPEDVPADEAVYLGDYVFEYVPA